MYWTLRQDAFFLNPIFMMRDAETVPIWLENELRRQRERNFTFFPIAVKVYPTAIR
ncbi:hypothetical protein RISK_003963 [Rhodopirellula islandica]|uniref:Uncharacterized protein n=1 Tax=Rhodopirellula islandica TaxID=595434 RepID=A0A0J1EEQ9_RHOIS|nr:hypothetical protein RISK_003963 [Rhodopirellula islandica]